MKKMLVGGLLFLSVITVAALISVSSGNLDAQIASSSNWSLNVKHNSAIKGKVLGLVKVATIAAPTTDSGSTTSGTGLCSIYSFAAPTSTLTSGESTYLSWNTSGCSSVYINGGEFNSALVQPYGNLTTSPLKSDTTYTLTGWNSAGPNSKYFTISVIQPPCSIGSFTATPTAVNYSSPTTLSYTASNCSQIILNGGEFINRQMPTDTGTISTSGLTQNTTYTLTGVGAAASDTMAMQASVTVNQTTTGPVSGCSIISFAATPATVSSGNSVTLSYNTNCTSLSLSGGEFSGQALTVPSGTLVTSPLLQNTTYTVTGANSTSLNNVAQSINVTVTAATTTTTTTTISTSPCIINTFSATPNPVISGSSTLLSYTASNCGTITLSGGEFASRNMPTASGTISTSALTQTTTYTLSGTNPAGTLTFTKSITVTVSQTTPTSPCVLSSFTATPSTTNSGQSTYLSWSGNGSACYANGGQVTLSGGEFGTLANGTVISQGQGNITTSALTQTTTYTLSSSLAGVSPIKVTVTVTAPTNNSAYFQINTTQLPSATVGVYYNGKIDFQYFANGTNYASNATFSGLPSGITTGSASNPNTTYGIVYNNPGSVYISGIPTIAGTYTVTLNLTDQNSANLNKQFTLVVNPASINGNLIPSDTFVGFNIKQGDPNPPVYVLHLTNASSGSVNYTISVPNQPSWLNGSYSTQTLTLVAGQVAGIGVAVDATKVSTPNTYTTNLVFSGNFANSPITIPINMVVSPAASSTTANQGAAHSAGTNVIASNGTVYFIDGTQKRAYTSGGAFLSYGFNSWSNVQQATSGDLALPNGPYVPPMDGSLISDNGTIYIITNGKRLGFANSDIFTSYGYSFKDVIPGDTSFMTTIGPITNTQAAHPAGTLINDNGTDYLVTCNGKLGIPSTDTFFSWGFSFTRDVVSNSFDNALQVLGILPRHDATTLSPTASTCQ